MALSSDANFERTPPTLTSWFQKWHEELGELSSEHSKVTDGLFLSKACNVPGRKFDRNYVS